MRVVFMGSPAFAVPALEALLAHHEVALVVTQTDKPAGRGQTVQAPPVKVAAEKAGIPVIQPRSARTDEFRDALIATGARIGVVVAYGKILPRVVLEAFPDGCVNIHASLLPKYRGAAPIQWALIRGESRTGITIMKLDEGMDTGPMLLARDIDIAETDTVDSLFSKLAPIGAELLIEALAAIEAGTAVATPQDDAQATYAPMLEKEHGVIDWSQSARDVANRIRGVDPWPGAATTRRGELLKLFAPKVVTEGTGLGAASGTVVAIGEQGLVVVCGGGGACAIGEVQPAGKKRMAARDWARGSRVAIGETLGQ